jgi:uncharacterized protein
MIDVHTHVASDKVLSQEFLQGISDDLFRGIPEQDRTPDLEGYVRKVVRGSMTDHSAQKLIREMEQANISKSVLLIIDLFYGTPEESDPIREIHLLHRRILQQYPDKLLVFSGVDPRRGREGLELFEMAVRDYGFRGLKLYPPCGFELDDMRLWPFYDFCQQHSIPVLTHTGPSLPTMFRETRFPQSLAAAASAFKKVDFIAAHALLGLFDPLTVLASEHSNVYLEISGFQTDGIGGQAILSRLGRAFQQIPDKILFGSDWPLFNFLVSSKRWIEHLQTLEGVSQEQWNKLFHDNALKLIER